MTCLSFVKSQKTWAPEIKSTARETAGYVRVPLLCDTINKFGVTELDELQASSLIGIGPVMGSGYRIITMGRMGTDRGKQRVKLYEVRSGVFNACFASQLVDAFTPEQTQGLQVRGTRFPPQWSGQAETR